MNFLKISTYLHCYDFPEYDSLLKYAKYFQKKYNDLNSSSQGVNVLLGDQPSSDLVTSYLDKIISNYYSVSPRMNYPNIGVYVQDKDNYISVSHNHQIDQTISSVIYLNPPKSSEGGKIRFHQQVYSSSFDLSPQPGKIYLFPSWVYHYPLPQTTNTPRICINSGYLCSKRPTHKLTGDLW